MDIHFSSREYRLLIDLLEISDWVLNSHRVDVAEEAEPYRALTQKLYSYAREMGFENLMMYDEEAGIYMPTKEFEETSEVFRFIEDFEEDTFWDELISRLAERDLLREYGESTLGEFQPEEMFEKRMELEQAWAEEFEANGIQRLDRVGE